MEPDIKLWRIYFFSFHPEPLGTPPGFIPIQRSFLISYLCFFSKAKKLHPLFEMTKISFISFFYVRNKMSKTKHPFGYNLYRFFLKIFVKCVLKYICTLKIFKKLYIKLKLKVDVKHTLKLCIMVSFQPPQ